jgi:hypothetical protein
MTSTPKHMNYRLLFSALSIGLIAISCKKEEAAPYVPPTEAKLIFKFKFDSMQARLNNVGQPEGIAAGHAAQNLKMKAMSSHYIELSPSATTALGAGEIMYKAPETTAGGENAIDFEKSKLAENDSVFWKCLSRLSNPAIMNGCAFRWPTRWLIVFNGM